MTIGCNSGNSGEKRIGGKGEAPGGAKHPPYPLRLIPSLTGGCFARTGDAPWVGRVDLAPTGSVANVQNGRPAWRRGVRFRV